MDTRGPVYMLAVDHRWQWDEWCDGAGVARTRIADLKALATDAFLDARARDARVAAHGALLIDTLYAATQIDRVRAAGAIVGTPAEWPGSYPLRWQCDPMSDALPGHFVKVLVKHRPDYPGDIVAGQVEDLLALQAWCRTHDRVLIVEVVVPREHEDEAAFEAGGRAHIVADYVRMAYAADLVPDYWKLEGTADADAAAIVDAAIAEDPLPRFLLLGKAADMTRVNQWFAAAQTMKTAAGFAIGRTVYFEPTTKWLHGEITRDDAREAIVATYMRLVDQWENVRASGRRGAS